MLFVSAPKSSCAPFSKQERNADGRDEQAQTWGLAERRVGDLFDHHTEDRARGNGDHDGGDRMHVEGRHRVVRGVGADHDDVAMREVQKQDNTVNHAVTERDQCVDRAGLQAVQNWENSNAMGFPLFPVCSESWCLRTPDGCCRLTRRRHPSDVRRVRRGVSPRRTVWTFQFVMSDFPFFDLRQSEAISVDRLKGNRPEFGKCIQREIWDQVEIWNTQESLCISFSKPKNWNKRSAEGRRHNFAVLPTKLVHL